MIRGGARPAGARACPIAARALHQPPAMAVRTSIRARLPTLAAIVGATALASLPSSAKPQALADQAAVPRLSSSISWERLRLPPGEVELEVDSLGARLALTPTKGTSTALAAAFRARPSTLCPRATVEDGKLLLRCRSRRIEAKLRQERGARFLDLHEVRGLPIDGSFADEPRIFWDPVKLHLGGPCPGDTAFARGECALRSGHDEDAAIEFEAARSDPRAAGAAALRLGDLAARQGDRALAAEHYGKAGHLGFWGRLGTARICELLGNCLGTRDEARIFDPVGMPEPLRIELVLRHARALAFRDEHAAACRLLAAEGNACKLGENLCGRIALEAMRADLPADRAEGLSLFVSLENRTTSPLAFELSAAAAEVAAAAGAPLFAANTLSVTVDFAPKRRLAGHLLRMAQLYLDAQDPVRAEVVADFAARRLTPKVLGAKEWAAVRAAVRTMSRKTPEPDGAHELDAARGAIGEAAAIATTPGT